MASNLVVICISADDAKNVDEDAVLPSIKRGPLSDEIPAFIWSRNPVNIYAGKDVLEPAFPYKLL